MSSGTPPSADRLLRWSALAAVLTNIGIVITGGAVRITGSGLGCPTWPTCDGDNLVPVAGGEHTTWQTAIEFGNRLLTFVVLAAAVAVFVMVRRTRPHTVVVERLAWALPVGIVGQALLGGVTVLTGLSPYTVAAHFLLSMALIAVAVALHEILTRPRTAVDQTASGVRATTWAVVAAAMAVLILGTVTTGSGPHGGDLTAPRFAVDIRLIAIAHADAVWLLVGCTVALVAVTWRSGPTRLRTAVRALLALEIIQGAIGYTQYAVGIPRTLVLLHVIGATLLWTTVAAVWLRARPDFGAPVHRSRAARRRDETPRPGVTEPGVTAPHDPEVGSGP